MNFIFWNLVDAIYQFLLTVCGHRASEMAEKLGIATLTLWFVKWWILKPHIFDRREINAEKIITVKYETYAVAEWKPAPSWLATILDKTVEKMSHSQSISLNMVAIPIPPSPLPLEEMLLCVLKQPWSLDVCRKQLWPGARGIWYRKSVVVEIVLLRTILCMKG